MRRILLVTIAIIGLAIAILIPYLTRMPGQRSTRLASLTPEEIGIHDHLRDEVTTLSSKIGERNIPRYENLQLARHYIARELTAIGYQVQEQTFAVDGREVANIFVEIPGATSAKQIVIFGAHYDSVVGTPGANDNASGVAATLELARLAHNLKLARTLRFVFFVNEEPPYFQSDTMGSVVYARRCRERKEEIVAMFSLETMGYYSDAPNSQQYPAELAAMYPTTGNFIAFASNVGSAPLLRRSVEIFRKSTTLPAEGGAAPESIPGVGWSDHWSFWKQGYPAVMLTDTAPYRYAYYHAPGDTPEKLDYDRLARAVTGVFGVLQEFASAR